jgi:hypothetical protein
MTEGYRDFSASVVRTNWPEERSGQGVVVAGGFVITAAHCVPTDHWTDGLFDGEALSVTNSLIQTVNMRPLFVDRCHDLAVLNLFDDSPRDWFAEIPPLPLVWQHRRASKQGFLVTHDQGLVNAEFDIPQYFFRPPEIAFKAHRAINGGSSGGPCLTSKGELLAVISNTQAPDNLIGYGAIVAPSLPRWIASAIREAEREEE